MNKLKSYLIASVITMILGIGFYGGWSLYPRLKPCPNITSDTITVLDTNWYKLEDSLKLTIGNLQAKVDYWKNHRDTIKLPGDSILVPADVDTAAILKDYFSIYRYGWEKSDSNITVVDSVTITENTPIDHMIRYKLNKPFTTIINTIDNSIWYNRYIQLGLEMPVYNLNTKQVLLNQLYDIKLNLHYIYPKGYVGVDWQPNTNILSVEGGINIMKLKNRK